MNTKKLDWEKFAGSENYSTITTKGMYFIRSFYHCTSDEMVLHLQHKDDTIAENTDVSILKEIAEAHYKNQLVATN